MKTERFILHIDMDAFFASVEQMDNPKTAGRPLIVGGNPEGRGVVAACSYEARKYGIHSAMSAANALRHCPHALFVRPRKERYQEVSSQIMDIFHNSAPLVEPLSLDEAFLDISDSHSSMEEATLTAEKIRSRIFHEVGLTCSAGVSYNKFLAKVASDINKPDGITVIPKEQALAFLADLNIGKFYGVGKVTEKKMHSLGVRCGKDLMRFQRHELERFFGKAGYCFYDMVRGHDTRPVQQRQGSKSIGTETTFHTDILELQQVEEVLQQLSIKVQRALERKDRCGATITLKVRYDDFVTVTRSLTLPSPLSCADEMMSHMPRLLQTTEAGRRRIRLLGLTLSNLSPRGKSIPIQLTLPFS